jgi:hypothetical protein
MKNKEELQSFKKMWTWLSGYPAHNREYYMTHVAELKEHWRNSCPLSNSDIVPECDGCSVLWASEAGSLCSDPGSPMSKWKTTEIENPDFRSYYASQVAILAIKATRSLDTKVKSRRTRAVPAA